MEYTYCEFKNKIFSIALHICLLCSPIPFGIFISRYFFFLYLISILIYVLVVSGVFEWPELNIPNEISDTVHMRKIKKYYISENGRVYVKHYGVWIRTERRADNMEDFLTQKAEYTNEFKA